MDESLENLRKLKNVILASYRQFKCCACLKGECHESNSKSTLTNKIDKFISNEINPLTLKDSCIKFLTQKFPKCDLIEMNLPKNLIDNINFWKQISEWKNS